MIRTYTGRMVRLLDPSPTDIVIDDIAWPLSRIQRWNGHTTGAPYSVAQHCVLVSFLVPTEAAMYGLLHDGAEAYLGDISRPLKRHLPDVDRIEAGFMRAIWEAFGLRTPSQAIVAAVKDADDTLLATEGRDLMRGLALPGLPVAMDRTIVPWLSWQDARLQFLARFEELRSQAVRP